MKISDLPPAPSGKTGWPWTEDSVDAGAATSSLVSPRDSVTVITPSFNQGKYLEQTIRSVLLQEHPGLEYFVLDAGSTDNSVEIIRKYEKHLAFWSSEPDGGQANALNKGFERASGDWVTWINSDDYLLPGALSRLLDDASIASTIEWVAGSVLFVSEGGAEPDEIRKQGMNPKLIDWLLQKSAFHQPGTLWKRSLFSRVGYLNESMHYAFDWEFWCRLAGQGLLPHIVDKPVAAFRHHDASKTCTAWDRFCSENNRILGAFLPRFQGRERRALERRRTSLVCTRIRHEGLRLLKQSRRLEVILRVLRAIVERPGILAKKTPYMLLIRSGLSPLPRLSPRTDG